MPAKSKAQFGFMHAVAAGKVMRPHPGLSKAQAAEFVADQSPKGLPKKKPKPPSKPPKRPY